VKSCRNASAIGVALLGISAASGSIGACHEPETPPVPPLTTAQPSAAPSPPAVPSGGSATPPSYGLADAGGELAASVNGPAIGSDALAIAFVDSTATVPVATGRACQRVFVIAAKGIVVAGTDTLRAGDVAVITYPDKPVDVKVTGLGVTVVEPLDCAKVGGAGGGSPTPAKTVVRGKDAPELKWAGGAIRAHLDVGTKISPELYLGRLEIGAPVLEHEHATSIETLIVLEGSGTLTIDGQEHRLGPRQVGTVPKKTKHACKPDPGSKLVTLQLYGPPGPEQRFIALAAAEKDAGAAK
jgi:mannose-6-phosphate isomerase-like protein (cupin superfamily)